MSRLERTVKPYKDEAYFWHQTWKSQGKPINTDLHNKMKQTRNKYHLEYKKCIKAEEKVKKNKLLEACITGNGNLFQEIKSLRQGRTIVATSMDGVNDNSRVIWIKLAHDL